MSTTRTSTDPAVLTVADVARQLRVNPATIYKRMAATRADGREGLVIRGRFVPAWRLGTHTISFSRQEVLAAVNGN